MITLSILQALQVAIDLSREDKAALPPLAKTTKMGEEMGELNEAVLQNHGWVRQDKPGVGTVMEECADMFFQVIDILQCEYPDYSADALTNILSQMMTKKLDKWIDKKMDLEPGVLARTLKYHVGSATLFS